ncbi:MAG: dUTP pyrophosphatase [Candidatus Sumerlaeota bacterium]|nr:dUTP pyrophosphatase [Candidatus Sumerlaeota bacterium]
MSLPPFDSRDGWRPPIPVRVERLPHAEGIELPSFATAGAAGADVRAAVDEELVIEPGRLALVPTGLKLQVPEGYEVQVRPRSGLALRHGITLPNSPGTIDADYRGELQVIMMNLGTELFRVRRGDRIAQLVLARVDRLTWVVVDSVDETARGTGGFGHTGTA